MIVSVVAVVLMCVFIFAMSAAPADDSDALSLGVAWRIVSVIVPGYDQLPAAEQLHWQEMLNHPVRKTAHFLEYALLGALTFNMLAQIACARLQERSRSAATSSHERSGPSALIRPHSEAPARSPESPQLEAPARPQGHPQLAAVRPRLSGGMAAAAWALATLYAVTDELHQLFVPGRTGMLSDVLLDSAGVLVGVLLCWLLLSRMWRRAGSSG